MPRSPADLARRGPQLEVIENSTFTPSRGDAGMRGESQIHVRTRTLVKDGGSTVCTSITPSPRNADRNSTGTLTPKASLGRGDTALRSTSRGSRKRTGTPPLTQPHPSRTSPGPRKRGTDGYQREFDTISSKIRPPYPSSPSSLRAESECDLRQKLRERERDVVYAVNLGQAILEDLKAAKASKASSEKQADLKRVCDALTQLRKKQVAAAHDFFATAQAAIEAKAAVLSGGVVGLNRKLTKDLEAARRTLAEQAREMAALRQDRDDRVVCDAEDLQRLAGEASKLRAEVNAVRRQVGEKDAAKERAEREVLHLQKQVQQLTSEIKEARQRGDDVIRDLSKQHQAAVKGLAVKDQELQRMFTSLEATRAEADSLATQLESLQADMEDLRQDKERLLQSRDIANSRAAEVEETVQRELEKGRREWRAHESQLVKELEIARARVVEVEEKLEAARSHSASCQAHSDAILRKADALAQENVQLKSGLLPRQSGVSLTDMLHDEVARLERERTRLSADVEAMHLASPRREGSALSRQLRGLEAQVTTLRVRVDSESRANDALREDNDTLRKQLQLVELHWKDKVAQLEGEVEALRARKEETDEEEEDEEEEEFDAEKDELRRERDALLAEVEALKGQLAGVRKDNADLRKELTGTGGGGAGGLRGKGRAIIEHLRKALRGRRRHDVEDFEDDRESDDDDTDEVHIIYSLALALAAAPSALSPPHSPVPPAHAPLDGFWTGQTPATTPVEQIIQPLRSQLDSTRAELEVLKARQHFSQSPSISPARTDGEHTASLKALFEEISATRGDIEGITRVAGGPSATRPALRVELERLEADLEALRSSPPRAVSVSPSEAVSPPITVEEGSLPRSSDFYISELVQEQQRKHKAREEKLARLREALTEERRGRDG